MEPVRQYSPQPNVLEVRAIRYLQSLAGQPPDGSRRLGNREVQALQRVERWAIAGAVGVGIVSGGLIGGVEIFVQQDLLEGVSDAGWRAQAPYWVGFFAVAGVISVVEIAFLYWNALRALAQVSRLGEIDLQGDRYRELVANGLVRAGLEFPNPRSAVFGIDPYARVSGWRLIIKGILYKTKVGVTSVVLRVVFRRVLTRMAVRGLVPLLAAPLYAAWNAFITWRLLREARLRALAPLVIDDFVDRLTSANAPLSPRARDVLLEGTGELMMRAADAHPNYVYLLARLIDTFGMEKASIEVDWEDRRAELGELDASELELVLDGLVIAALLPGQVRRAQTDLLEGAHEQAGLTFRPRTLLRLRRKLLEGRHVLSGDLEAVRA